MVEDEDESSRGVVGAGEEVGGGRLEKLGTGATGETSYAARTQDTYTTTPAGLGDTRTAYEIAAAALAAPVVLGGGAAAVGASTSLATHSKPEMQMQTQMQQSEPSQFQGEAYSSSPPPTTTAANPGGMRQTLRKPNSTPVGPTRSGLPVVKPIEDVDRDSKGPCGLPFKCLIQ